MNKEEFNQLILKIADKDKNAFEQFYLFYAKKIKWAAYNIIKDWHYAEDVLDEVLIKIWNKASKFPKIESPDAWIYRLTKLTAIDYYRSKVEKHKNVINIDSIPDTIHKGSDNLFFEMIDALDDISRGIVIMRIQFGLTFKEIAKDLKIPPGTVPWKYNSAMKKLKEKNFLENSS